MLYKEGYKYQLYETEYFQTGLRPEKNIVSPSGFIELHTSGLLIVHKGYAWDGPSGPSFDTKTFMRASLFHDACYQLLREGLLPKHKKKYVDRQMKEICLDDGMNKVRAWYSHEGVKRFASRAAKRGNTRPILRAP